MIQDLHVNVQGERAHFVHQSSDGPPVVLVHGAGGNASIWSPTLPHWRWANVWCPNLPGRLGSTQPPLATTEELATWLGQALDELKLDSPILVGHSMGGGVALTLALQQPNRFQGVALVCSGLRLRVSDAVMGIVKAATPDNPFDFTTSFLPSTPSQAAEAYQQNTQQTPPETGFMDWQACNTYDVRDRLDKLACPLLVVYGTSDVLTPAKYQERIPQRVPEATLAPMDAGHMLPWERPKELSGAVASWVRRL
ncbi:MAG: alpha/beta hydrolase [Deltaproteobacteria bacterium]|nr:MAG: alpha/beta hydrolase [Deltaproteobacteria bacterium]